MCDTALLAQRSVARHSVSTARIVQAMCWRRFLHTSLVPSRCLNRGWVVIVVEHSSAAMKCSDKDHIPRLIVKGTVLTYDGLLLAAL